MIFFFFTVSIYLTFLQKTFLYFHDQTRKNSILRKTYSHSPTLESKMCAP